MKVVVLAHFETLDGNSIASVVCKNALAMAALGHEVLVLLPLDMNIDILCNHSNLTYKASPKYIRGGFGLIECLWRINQVKKFRPAMAYVYRGHRPSALIPSLFFRFCLDVYVQNELWERYDFKSIGRTRTGKGLFVAVYDHLFDKVANYCYSRTITINNHLHRRLGKWHNKITLLGAMDVGNLIKFDKLSSREELELPNNQILIGLSNVDLNDLDDLKVFCESFNSLGLVPLSIVITGKNSFEIAKLFNSNCYPLGWLSYERYSKYLSSVDMFYVPYPPTERNKSRWPNKIGDYLFYNKLILSNPTGQLNEFNQQESLNFYLCNDTKSDYVSFFKSLLRHQINMNVYSNHPLLTFEQRAKIICEF